MERPQRKSAPRILIIGAGSVGKRHAENFQKLGVDADCVDPRSDRRAEFQQLYPLAQSFALLGDALKSKSRFCGAVICSPTAFHVSQASECSSLSIPVLMEKPLSADLESALNLKAQLDVTKVPLLLGYTWRWWPALEKVRSFVTDGKLGRPYYARFTISAHLADWHPWEDYREFFMAHEKLGGGALLDESHWIDQMIWLFGIPHAVFGVTRKLSELEISSDDLVELVAFYHEDLVVSVHLDIFGRPHEKSIQIYGDNGSISWSEEKKSVQVVDTSANIMVEEFNHDRNFMFERVAEEFLSMIQKASRPSCTIDDGIKVLEVVEAIRNSQRQGRCTRINEEKDVS